MLNHDDQTKFIEILQNNISRMANNSVNCKNWCLGILTAICALLIKRNNLLKQDTTLLETNIKYFLIFPVLMFFILDSYYLSIERNMRKIYNQYITKISLTQNEAPDDTYKFNMDTFVKRFFSTICCFSSTSTWPYYFTLSLLLYFFLRSF